VFTGIVESVGQVVEVARRPAAWRLCIACAWRGGKPSEGESVAVDGVCLTVTARRRGRIEVDVVPETLKRTTLATVRAGRRVNLERALRVGDRLSGHWVAGHVDATARILAVRGRGTERSLGVALLPGIRRFIAGKGSVTVDGVSLTVAAVRTTHFEVALVPYTLEHTTLGRLRRGQRVNVEVDLLARYLEPLLEARRGGTRP